MRRLKELTQKEQLDKQTSYLTFLPHMDEGFHTGYHTSPGVVSDHNKRPAEWLESMARYMRTQGEDVGYSIPDVLACEQQLRRLSRLDVDEIADNRQMVDYRAVLALLLLWDTWEKDASWPVLDLICLSGQNTPFSASVTAALTPSRAPDGLWVFALRSSRSAEAAVHPIALVSNAMVLIPAADPGDLSTLLPPCVRWYDRAAKCFTDPCALISQRDAFMLVSRLRVLQGLKEQPEWHSPLLQADEQLVSLLGRFAEELMSLHTPWQKKLLNGDESTLRGLRLRLLAADMAQDDLLPIQKTVVRPSEWPLMQNPLLRTFAPSGLPSCPADEMTLYTLDGIPFAAQSHETLLKPCRDAEETVAMRRLETEMALIRQHDVRRRQQASAALRRHRADCALSTGIHPLVPVWLETWACELDALPSTGNLDITVPCPMEHCPAALRILLAQALDMTDEALIRNVFSDALLIWDSANVYDNDVLSARCRVEGVGTAVPPLSPTLCSWLMESYDRHGENAPRLDQNALHFTVADGMVTASLRITRRSSGKNAALSAVTFTRSYRLRSGVHFEEGSAAVLPASQCPGITVWPNARFASGLWKAYYVFAEQTGAMSAWAYGSHGWKQGEWHTNAAASWQTVHTDAFPAFVALRRGEVTFGALVNDIPCRLLKHEPAAAVAVDFGSISTTVMLRQGDQIQPASLPECMHCTLLKPAAPTDLLTNAFLPRDALLPGSASEATTYSLMDMFTDRPENWNVVLRDGHIYYRSTLDALAQKNASALYYDLKWSDEPYAQRVMRLFLKQIMLQASLSARLWGSTAISWRVSMPNAMPLHRQEAYLEMMRGLAREMAQESGMPLVSGAPSVLFATENQADGLYFLSRSEINAKSGYINLDIGGSTADLSLWLGGANHASIESSLLMGCRQMLFASLMERHALDFEHDFDGMDPVLENALHRVTEAYRREGSTTRGQNKCMLLLDDLLATHAPAIRRCMAQSRAEGRISYFECLLLVQVGFLFYLSGEMLQRAWQDSFMRMLMPPRMEVCIAGNGGQLLKAFSEEQHAKLCSLSLARLDAAHPLQALLPIQSRHPKQEVARGLLYDDTCLQSAIRSVERFNGTRTEDTLTQNLLMDYLLLFYHVFPQAAQRLMPRAYEDHGTVALSAAARMELDTIFANEAPRETRDDMAVYVRCFDALKRLWNI